MQPCYVHIKNVLIITTTIWLENYSKTQEYVNIASNALEMTKLDCWIHNPKFNQIKKSQLVLM
jgi:hypothetical protein